MLRATVAMPGSCGELAQGTLEGIPFHITCPVDIFSLVTVELEEKDSHFYPLQSKPKASTAFQKTLDYLGKNTGGKLMINSLLPLSKGMASSTADVAGAIEAVCYANGYTPNPSLVAEIALSVEPSDGTFFPDIVAFDHQKGKLLIPLGTPPPLDIIVLDCGGEVDTLAFNAQDRRDILKRCEPQFKEAFSAIREGIAKGDTKLIGLGATISARVNQEVLFKPQLEKAQSLAREVDALGISVGHSGTVIGILLDSKKSDTKAVAAYLAKKLDDLELLFSCSLVGGGGRLLVNSFPQKERV